jgi:hypothetical protein
MKCLAAATVGIAIAIGTTSAVAADPLVVGSDALRALLLAYGDLEQDPGGGGKGAVSRVGAAIYTTSDRIEIVFFRDFKNGMESRGGGRFYAIDRSTLQIIEERPEK